MYNKYTVFSLVCLNFTVSEDRLFFSSIHFRMMLLNVWFVESVKIEFVKSTAAVTTVMIHITNMKRILTNI